VVHRFAELIAPSRLGRSFRWLLASSLLHIAHADEQTRASTPAEAA
jgi:hypothetical protein